MIIPQPLYVRSSFKNLPIGWAIVVFFSANLLLIASAKISVPFYPVPLSMQTLVLLMMPVLLGFRMSLLVVISYLIEGALGLPVFSGTPAKGIGLAYMLGPTAGYLAGFVVASAVVGLLADKCLKLTFGRALSLMIIGHITIYAMGLSWLGILLGWSWAVIQVGLLPFIVGDLLKSFLAAAILYKRQ